MSIYGNPVMLGGSGSAPSTVEWGEPIIRNWDFTNPLNTRGQTTYTGSGSTINGWQQVSTTKCLVVDGGIKVQTNGGNTNMYFALKIASGAESGTYSGKTMTLSMMANNNLQSDTFVLDTSQVRQSAVTIDGLQLWFNRDSATSYAFGFYNTGSGNDTLIQAIKLEFGSVSTLCNVNNGVASLRRHQVLDEEILFLPLLGVNN